MESNNDDDDCALHLLDDTEEVIIAEDTAADNNNNMQRTPTNGAAVTTTTTSQQQQQQHQPPKKRRRRRRGKKDKDPLCFLRQPNEQDDAKNTHVEKQQHQKQKRRSQEPTTEQQQQKQFKKGHINNDNDDDGAEQIAAKMIPNAAQQQQPPPPPTSNTIPRIMQVPQQQVQPLSAAFAGNTIMPQQTISSMQQYHHGVVPTTAPPPPLTMPSSIFPTVQQQQQQQQPPLSRGQLHHAILTELSGDGIRNDPGALYNRDALVFNPMNHQLIFDVIANPSKYKGGGGTGGNNSNNNNTAGASTTSRLDPTTTGGSSSTTDDDDDEKTRQLTKLRKDLCDAKAETTKSKQQIVKLQNQMDQSADIVKTIHKEYDKVLGKYRRELAESRDYAAKSKQRLMELQTELRESKASKKESSALTLKLPPGPLGVEIVGDDDGYCTIKKCKSPLAESTFQVGDRILGIEIPFEPSFAINHRLGVWAQTIKGTANFSARSVRIVRCSAQQPPPGSSAGKDDDDKPVGTTQAASSSSSSLDRKNAAAATGLVGQNPTLSNSNIGQKQCQSQNRILLLDGGVSTHLEDMGAKFKYRQLWSSSLLLGDDTGSTNDGHNRIRNGHLDWLRAGSNIITTVTYQLHYDHNLLPYALLQQPPSASAAPAEQQLDAHVSDDGGLITRKRIDQMYETSIDLAFSAIREYFSTTNTTTTTTTDRPLFVLVSMGCYGAALANGAEYTGDYTIPMCVSADPSSPPSGGGMTKMMEEYLYKFYKDRFDYLASRCSLRGRQQQQHQPAGTAVAAASGIGNGMASIIETVPSITEVRAISRLLSNTSVATPNVAWISLACRNGQELNDGTPVSAAIRALKPAIDTCGVWGIGFNCCKGEYLISLVTILMKFMIHECQHNRPMAIVIYPNSGEGWDAAAEAWTGGCNNGAPPGKFSDMVFQVIEHIEDYWRQHAPAGILLPTVVVGGCCRTKPADIQALRNRIDAHLQNN